MNNTEQVKTIEQSAAGEWAKPVERLTVRQAPPGAVNLNVDGRKITSPLQGFGQMWQKTYRVRLPGVSLKPAEAMAVWRAEFPSFQPAETRFYPPMTGIQPGQVMFIDLKLPVFPGLPNLIPVTGGVMVLYVDDVSFTVMTPEGFVVSGWNTFSIAEEDGGLVAQIQSIERATDPIYEIGTRFMGGARRQEENWRHVLTQLAKRLSVAEPRVEMARVCVDPKLQWSEAKNIWQNAGVRTVLYRLAAPLRWVRRGK